MMKDETVQNKKHTPTEIDVRRYMPGDEQALQQIYFESTRRLNSKDYTPKQIERWVAKHADFAEWTLRLQKTNPFVAFSSNKPIAFGELESDGHIDFFYCHPDWQGQGAGSKLLKSITTEALQKGVTSLYAEVSVTAESFFTKKGFQILEVRIPIICEAPAKQYLMRKELSDKK